MYSKQGTMSQCIRKDESQCLPTIGKDTVAYHTRGKKFN
jgi:hypothetical protein